MPPTILPERQQGTVSPVAVEEKIQWVTAEEAEELDKLLFKPFIKKGDKYKAENAKFIYRIIGSHPFVPSNVLTASGQHLVKFEIRKFYRNEFIVQKRREGGIENEERINKPVEWVALDEMGNGKMMDRDASFFCEARKFQEFYERDRE
jgi:hypothetical protein